MDSGHGRRKTPLPAPLILLGALNAIALVVLIAMWRHYERGLEPVHAGETSESTSSEAESDEVATTHVAPPLQPRDERLTAQIQVAIDDALAEAGRRSKGKVTRGNTIAAVHVVELGVDRELVSLSADAALRPASSLKLLPAIASLVMLGEDGHFETVFEGTGRLSQEALEGDLIVRAGGDPLYSGTEGDQAGIEAWLDRAADELRSAGVHGIRGDLVLDEGSFLEPGPGPAWPSADQHWDDYCALSAGFSVNAGCYTARVRPGGVGGSATVDLVPRDGDLKRRGSVTTGKKGTSLTVAVGANSGGVTVRGSIPSGSAEYEASFAHPDPVDLFGSVLSMGLARRGIAIGGAVRRVRGTEAGTVLGSVRSPMKPLLKPVLLDSHNSLSDQLLFATAHQLQLEGTRAGGAAVAKKVLESFGVETDGFACVDGSGLSRDNALRPRQFTALLGALHRTDSFSALVDALPVAGESGSLERRMVSTQAQGRVFAKTGFIGGTSSLVGVVQTLDGRWLAFAVMVNYPVVSGLNTHCWKPMGDRICNLLVKSEAL